jgi:predicted pyridoxine 5'-phosphate oxidase superfamily flavin-nucleotide-binding protein
MTEYLMTGPEHLAEAARLAHEAVDGDYWDEPARQRLAAAAQAHASIAQTLVFASLAAADTTEPELAAPWLAILDPDGRIRAAQERRAQERREEAQRTAAEWQAKHGQSLYDGQPIA